MLGFTIADFYIAEDNIHIPSRFGIWQLNKVQQYNEIIETRQPGQSATTFVAINQDVNPKIGNEDFKNTIRDLLDREVIRLSGTFLTY